CALPLAQARPDLPAELLSLSSPALVFSACKRSERNDGVIIRFWNIGGAVEPTELRWGLPYSRCERVELSEEPSAKPAPRELAPGHFALQVQPYEIVTLKLSDN
ncbi:MAG: glycosyl hydrolase-related protein, partial [Chloroflexi bacterium]|nr:glycosyl hydrolase-related protein [Chloroflexota bacterium]